MTAETRRRRADALFEQALDLAPEERGAFLREACAGDVRLRALIDELLAQDDEPDPALDAQAIVRGPLLREVARGLAGEGPAEDGARVGPWKLAGELGRGGMGTVHRAERADGAYEQTAALKLIHPTGDAEEIARRFARERQILASLEHPGIARLIDGGRTADGRPYLVMERVEGRPIDRYCDEERLGVDERLALFLLVARAVEYAHRNLVIHRDLKPSNIVVTDDGAVKLLDFGIARVLSPEGGAADPLTRTVARVLTPEYASPEQVLGGAVTTASDVYQLGLLLYELLSGERAHRLADATPTTLERVVCRQEPPAPSEQVAGTDASAAAAARRTTPRALRRKLRGDLDNIVLTAVRKEPERRYASATELIDDVERYRTGFPVRARPETLGYRAQRFVRRHPVGAAAATAFALLVGAYAVTVTEQARRLAAERDLVRTEAQKAERVRDFLVELFAAADPYGERGIEVTAGELVEAGAREIRNELGGDPEVRAELLGTLGQVLSSLAAYERAEELLAEALEMERGLHGGDHPHVARALHRRATALHDLGEYEEAGALVREALAMRQRLFPGSHAAVVEGLRLAARSATRLGDPPEAERLYREALAMHRYLVPSDDARTASLLNDLGVALDHTGKIAEAERAARESLRLRRRLLEPEHPAVSESLNNLAVVLRRQGRLAEAAPLYREALEIRRRVFGNDHPRVANALNNLGVLLTSLGEAEEAARAHREALEIRRRALGEVHSNVALSLHNLASARRDAGAAEEAERLYREALAMFRETLPAGHRLLSYPALALGRILVARGALEEAEPLLSEALEVRQAAMGEEAAATAEARAALGLCRAAQGRSAEAASLLGDGLAVLRTATGADSELIAAAELALASLPPPEAATAER